MPATIRTGATAARSVHDNDALMTPWRVASAELITKCCNAASAPTPTTAPATPAMAASARNGPRIMALDEPMSLMAATSRRRALTEERAVLEMSSNAMATCASAAASVADCRPDTTVKNGWDTRSADGGLWAVNTIGRVTSGADVNVSIAVLSHNNQSMDAGIAEVEKVAKLTRQNLKY